ARPQSHDWEFTLHADGWRTGQCRRCGAELAEGADLHPFDPEKSWTWCKAEASGDALRDAHFKIVHSYTYSQDDGSHIHRYVVDGASEVGTCSYCGNTITGLPV